MQMQDLTSNNSAWAAWYGGLPETQQQGLVHYLKSIGALVDGNGRSQAAEMEKEIEIICTDAKQLLEVQLKRGPNLHYEDIYGILPLYDQLAFQTESCVLAKGHKGTGKTLSQVVWCYHQQLPHLRLGCNEGTNKLDVKGLHTMRGRSTPFTLGRVAAAFKIANEYGVCVLIFEEINALPQPIQKMINSCIDFTQSIEVEVLQETFSLDKGARFQALATANPSTYGATYELNEDLKSRIIEIEFGYPTQAQELQILRSVLTADVVNQSTTSLPNERKITEPAWHLVSDDVLRSLEKFADNTRHGTGYAFSTRDVVTLIKTVSLLGLEKGLQLALHKFEGEDRKVAYKLMTTIWPTAVTGALRRHWGSHDAPDVDRV